MSLVSPTLPRKIIAAERYHRDPDEKIDWVKSLNFLLVHLAGFCAPLAGVSWPAIAMCLFLYFFRMFAVTGGYHRYFSHRSYKTSRWFQFLIAIAATSSGQKGPLWWAGHHRHHHKYSDQKEDVHSPILSGFWWSHLGWILCNKYVPTREESVKDLMAFPELRWLNRYQGIPPFLLGLSTFLFGQALGRWAPALHTNGLQMLLWGFFTSTVLLYHGTFVINSLTHMMGRQKFKTNDYSKNSFLLALVTMGEGWHNNHHRFPYAESQGIRWWELDMTHYLLKTLSWTGLIWDLQPHPPEAYPHK